MYSFLIVTRFRTFLMLAIAFLIPVHPCLAVFLVDEACPMAGCATPGTSVGSADCCCLPGGSTAEISTVSAVVAPQTTAGLGATHVPRPGEAVRLARSTDLRLPETVPLFLKHATLLI